MSSVNDEYREVDFKKYCNECKYKNYPEESDICTECLAKCTNEESVKPMNFKQLGKNEKPEKYDKSFSKEEKDYLKAVNNVFEV